MRLLSIGFPLPHPDIDNYNVLTAPSYFDYDAVFIDPANLSLMARQVVEGGDPVEGFDGRPVVNGQTTAAAVGAADQFRRRLGETERLLEQGGVVIVVGRPNVTTAGILGFEGCDRYSWLPAPEGMSWSAPLLAAGEGKNVRLVDDHHPLAAVVRDYRRYVGFRALFDARHSAFARSGRVWAEARPGLAVGADFEVLGGRVSFLPAIAAEAGLQRAQLAEAVVGAARALVGLRDAESPPGWISEVTLPGLADAEADVRAQKEAIERAEDLLEDARARVAETGIYRDMVWADGPAYREAVRRSLILLGFEETSAPGAPLALREGETTVFVEIESSRGEVAEWPYVRLQRRLEEHLLRRREALKGLVVANGFRHSSPAVRKDRISDPLRIACENYRYTLVTAEALLGAVERILERPDDLELREGVRRRLLRGAGLLDREVLLGEKTDDGKGTLF